MTIRLTEHNFSFINQCWLLPIIIIIFSLIRLETASGIGFCHISPVIAVRLTGLVPQILLLEYRIWHLPSSSPRESFLITMTFQTSSRVALQWHQLAPSALMDTSHLVPWSCLMSSLLQNFPWVSGTWDSWRPVLRRKQRRHCVPQPSPCPVPPGPLPIYQQAYVSPKLPFAVDLPVEVVLVTLNVPYQIQLQMDFSFPIPISACLDRSTLPGQLVLLIITCSFLFMS